MYDQLIRKCGTCVKNEQNYLKCMRSKGGKGNAEKILSKRTLFCKSQFSDFLIIYD